MSQRLLSVRLAADVARYVAGMSQAAAATDRVSAAGGRLEGAGKKMSAGITVPTLAAGAASVRTAVQFESAFTGVQKTVDATASQLAGLKDGIVAMSKEVPSSREEIAGIAESAGQLGIQTGAIMDFTRVMVDLGNATNLVGQEGASQLARFANITQMPQNEFERLGSSVVALGNNMATTEADIVSMSLRLAGAGNIVGMSEAQILGVAAALSSVGVEAEAGGSSMSTAMLRMQKAVNSGSSELATFAQAAGMTSAEFASLFKQDSASALDAFVQGLGRVNAAGGDANAVLESVGMTEIRMRQAFLGLAGASGVLTDALGISSKAWQENSALAAEASLRYGTTESRLKIMQNRLSDVGRKIGELLIPVVLAGANVIGLLADGAGALVSAFDYLPSPLKAVAGGLLGVTVVAGPTILALLKITALLGPLRVAMLALSTGRLAAGLVSSGLGLAGWVTNLRGAVAAMSAAMVTGQGLGSALMGLGAAIGPQIALVAALAAVAAGIYALKRAHDEFEAKHRTAAESAKELADALGLASGELRAFNAAVDESGEPIKSDQQFALDASDAVKTLRELKRESTELAQGRLIEIAFRMQLEGNSPEDVLEAVTRLANVAGIEIPATLTLEGISDFDAQVKSAVRSAQSVAPELVINGKAEVSGPDEKKLTNIAQMASDAYATGNVSGFVQMMGESEQALDGNAAAANYLADEFLKLSGAQDVSLRNTTNMRDMLEELSRASNVAEPDKAKFETWLTATEGMDDAAATARIVELAMADAAAAAAAAGDGAADGFDAATVSAEDFASALDRMQGELALSTLDFDAGAAAAAAWGAAMDRATLPASRLSAGLAGGKAFNALKEGMTGTKALAEVSDKATKKTSAAASAVDRLADSARRADPKMNALQMRLDALSAAGDAFSSSIDNSSMLDDQVSSALNLGDAFKEFEKTYRRLPHNLDMTAMATGKLRKRQAEAVTNTLSLGKAARDYLSTLVEMGKSGGEVAGEAGRMRAEYSRMFREMGMGEAQINSYIEAMGLTPKQIDTAIKLSGMQLAQTQLSAYLSLLDGKIPPTVATSVVAKLDKGDVAGAAKQLADFARTNPALIEVGVDQRSVSSTRDQIDEVKSKLWELPKSFDPLKAMLGGYTDAQTAALDAVLAFGDGVQDYLSRVAHDGNAEEIKGQAYAIRDAFLEQLESFGIVGDAAQEYLDLIGLSDWQIESAISLSGDADAMFRLQMYAQFMTDEIPPEITTRVLSHLDNGNLQAAARELEMWRQRESGKPVTIPMIVQTRQTLGGYDGGLFAAAERKVKGARASGGPVTAGRWLVGENGPEIAEFGSSGYVYNASDTARMLAPGVPAGSNLMAVPQAVALDAKSMAALGRAGGDGVTFSGDWHIRAVEPKATAREVVERVGGGLHRGGR